MEGGTGMCCGHDPFFQASQRFRSALPSLPIYHQCAAHVLPAPFQFLEKFCIFSLVFGQNFSSHDAKCLNFLFQDPSFFKENPLPRPYFWKPVRHICAKKKKRMSAPSLTHLSKYHTCLVATSIFFIQSKYLPISC